MHPRQLLDALLGITAVVDPDGMTGPLQGLVGLLRPGFAGRIEPGPGFQGLSFAGTALGSGAAAL